MAREHKKTKRGYYEKQLTTNIVQDNGTKLRVTGLSKNSYEEACEDARKKKEEAERLHKIKVIQNTPTTKEPLKYYILMFMKYKHEDVPTKYRWTDSTYSTNMDIYNSKFSDSRIGNMQLKNLSVNHFQDFFDRLTLTQGLNINYVKNIRLLLIQTFEYIDQNICKIENYPKYAGLNEKWIDELDLSYVGDDWLEEKGQVLTDDEIMRFYEMAVINNGTYRYIWAYVLMISAGFRPQELLALTINDIDFEKKEITVCKAIGKRKKPSGKGKELYIKTTKNKVIRKLYMDEIMEDAIINLQKSMKLKLHKEYDDTFASQGLLIYNTKGKLVDVESFSQEFKRICHACGITIRYGEGSYCLRHTWVSKNNLYHSKNPLALAAVATSLAAGHTVETDLGTYTHVDINYLKENIKNPIKLSRQQEENEDYQEFLEFKKWKQMMKEQGN